MLERTAHDHDLVTYQSPLLRGLGVRHGFTTRHGGTSRGRYASLNLAALDKGVGDDNTDIAENFRRLRRVLGMERLPRDAPRQVHGRGVWTITGPPTRPADAPEADAVVTALPDRMLVIRTADCVPVLLASVDGSIVAAVHAGWRGVVAGVVPAAMAGMMTIAGESAEGFTVAIGPAISVEHFEVGPEVAEHFIDAHLPDAVVPTPGDSAGPHVDLTAAILRQLAAAGIPRHRIDTTDRCTYRDEADFFSHRRDVTHRGQPATGRMAALITPRQP